MVGRQINLDIRPMQDGDSHHLVNIDLKSSEFPFEFEDWQLLARYFPEWKIVVGALDGTPAAFAIVEFDQNDMYARVHKIVALESAKRLGVHTTVLNQIEYEACIGGYNLVEIPVPECQCRGGDDPYDLSSWLKTLGYTCVRTDEGMFEGYGKDMDGFIFHKVCYPMEAK